MLDVLFGSTACHQNIIDVSIGKVQPTQNLIYKVLEGLSSVLKAKRHPKKPEHTEWDSDCCFRYIFWCNGNLMICPTRSNLENMAAPCKVIEKS